MTIAAIGGREMDRVSDDILATFLAWLEPDSGAFDQIGRAQRTSLRGILAELQQRRAQTCGTCGDRDGCAIVVAVGVDGYCSYWEAKENG